MKTRLLPAKPVAHQVPGGSRALPLTLVFFAFALGEPARSQEPMPPAQSIPDAARVAREQKANSATPAKVLTNDELPARSSSPTEASASPEPSTSTPAQPAASTSQAGDCSNPLDDRVKALLQEAQDELDHIHRDLAYDPKVISDGDVDMTNFKPGSSGVAFGSPPLMETQPQAPERVSAVFLEDRIALLKKAARAACESSEDSRIQQKLDSAEKQLEWLQREFDLDRNAYYSKSNYADDTAGRAKLDDEQQQIQALQAEIDSLKQQLPPQNNPSAE